MWKAKRGSLKIFMEYADTHRALWNKIINQLTKIYEPYRGHVFNAAQGLVTMDAIA